MPKKKPSLEQIITEYPYYCLFIRTFFKEIFSRNFVDIPENAPFRSYSLKTLLTSPYRIPKEANKALRYNRTITIGSAMLHKLINIMPESFIKSLNEIIDKEWHNYLARKNTREPLPDFAKGNLPRANQDFRKFSLNAATNILSMDDGLDSNFLVNLIEGILPDDSICGPAAKGRYALSQMASHLVSRDEPGFRGYASIAGVLCLILFGVALMLSIGYVVVISKSQDMLIIGNVLLVVLILTFFFGMIISLKRFTNTALDNETINHDALETYVDGFRQRHANVLNHETFNIIFAIALRVNDAMEAIGIASMELDDRQEPLVPELITLLLEFTLPQLEMKSWNHYKPLLEDLQAEAERLKAEAACCYSLKKKLSGPCLKTTLTNLNRHTNIAFDTVEVDGDTDDDTEEEKKDDGSEMDSADRDALEISIWPTHRK
jgi:hypothetical protein